MLKYCNNDILNSKNIDRKYMLLYQVWKELTEQKTLDTYQYRIMNTLSGMRELNLVIEQRLNNLSTSNHNINDCKQELSQIIRTDDTLEKHYPTIRQRLLAHLGEKTDTPSQQRALHHQLMYCYNEIHEHYFEKLFEDLENDILEDNSEKIIIKAGRLISNCVTIGWSTQTLHRIINDLNESATDTNRWDIFKNHLLKRKNYSYTIYIPIKSKPKPIGPFSKNQLRDRFHQELKDMGLQIKNPEQMKELVVGIAGTSANLESCYFMVINVEAVDQYAASQMAINKCSDIMSLLSFFNSIEAWDIRELKWLVINNDTSSYKWVKYGDLYGTYDYLEGAKKLIAASKSIISRETSVQRKLRTTFSYANMGKASSAQEEKFINTWVALESLCRGDVYENIINNVLETVPPALCSRYIYKLFRNFIEDCLRCNVSFTFSTGEIWNTSDSNEEKVKKVIALFNNSNLYSELQSKCQVNDLLICRCNQLYELATDHKTMISKIDRHYNNVRLQLSRLYRIRNEIAHDALDARGTLLLYIEHLDDYLSATVAEIVMCSKKKQIDDIELIFEVIKDNYQAYCDIKTAKKGANPMAMLSPLFETGIIDLI